MLAGRAPPLLPGAGDDATWTVRVPAGAAPRASKSLAQFAGAEGPLARYVIRWGESLDDIAARRKVHRSSLASMNGVRTGESLRPGTAIFVPAGATDATGVADAPADPPAVVVPAEAFSYPDRKRVFYRVIAGDSARDLASVFSVSADEIVRWNQLDPGAALHEGMTLQIFVPSDKVPSDALVLPEKDARVLVAGTPEFFAHFEAQRGRTRLEMVAKPGDTWRTIAHRYGLSMGQIERINHHARSSAVNPGDRYVVYVPSAKAVDAAKKGAGGPADEDPYEGAAVAVAKPVEEDAAPAKDKDEDGVKPAALRKAGDGEAVDALKKEDAVDAPRGDPSPVSP
jgi:membrane-bound lytic murein transglycosylase D